MPESLADESDPEPERPATAEQLAELVGEIPLQLPPSFRTFVGSPVPRSRVRSCTCCYLDLAHFLAPVGKEGRLVHFLSDQQWVLHWLLYCDSGGADAVVVTDSPLGFDLGDETEPFDAAEAAVCAESFSEFLHRFRIENEIWFALAAEERSLTDEERANVSHYA